MHWPTFPRRSRRRSRQGAVIPAHPLALDAERQFDERRSARSAATTSMPARAASRSACTRRSSRSARSASTSRCCELAVETARAWTDAAAGRCRRRRRPTAQAVEEARTARADSATTPSSQPRGAEGRERGRADRALPAVADEMPLIGFYLQPAVGGIPLSRALLGALRRDRERRRDQGRAVQPLPHARRRPRRRRRRTPRSASRSTPATTTTSCRPRHAVGRPHRHREVTLRFRGGLLGHWRVWTRGAVKLLERCKLSVSAGAIPPDVLALDTRHRLQQRVLRRRQRLRRLHPRLPRGAAAPGPARSSIECLDPHEKLSPGQSEGIDRLYATYPELHDDAFVAANLERWRN